MPHCFRLSECLGRSALWLNIEVDDIFAVSELGVERYRGIVAIVGLNENDIDSALCCKILEAFD